MTVVTIFDGKLYAFRHRGRQTNELRRLLKLWKDIKYVFDFLNANIADLPKNKTIPQLASVIQESAYEIEDILMELAHDPTKQLEEFFRPLNNNETNVRVLSLQKGRDRYLRIYALKIDENCFVITGGAIKFTHFMEERKHTEDELAMLNRCRDYLNSNGVFDADSFFELITEKQ